MSKETLQNLFEIYPGPYSAEEPEWLCVCVGVR